MPDVYVLLTAMPPTTGHMDLVRFADTLSNGYAEGGNVSVILNTQPHEPYHEERYNCLEQAIRAEFSDVMLLHMHEVLEQNPEAPGFWEMWRGIMLDHGFQPGDVVVASETYGKRLAEMCGGKFMPYDIDRSINRAKATNVRDDPLSNFDQIIGQFQKLLRTTVTIFGAESTGKTTLSKQLAALLNGHFLFEYARPYLENTTNEITVGSMTDIWQGQRALQDHAFNNLTGKPYIIQDTDLFSTVGYWRLPHWHDHLGDCPDQLVGDALYTKSELYIVCPSTIPFEEDPLRYGGDHREGSDEYWMDVVREFDLPHHVLTSTSRADRLVEATRVIVEHSAPKFDALKYDRQGY